jgi:hypothetical protein
MEKRDQEIEVPSESRRSGVLSLAMAVGLIALFLTSEIPGGLTGIQGFFVGFLCVIILFVLAAILDEYKKKSPEQQKTSLSSLGDVSITQKDGQDVITIQIYVNKSSAN